MSLTIDQLRTYAEADYTKLCQRLELAPIPLEIALARSPLQEAIESLTPDQLSASAGIPSPTLCQQLGIELTPENTFGNIGAFYGDGATPGDFRIILRYGDEDLYIAPEGQPIFPPQQWNDSDPGQWDEWPQWRIDLWHETVHQVEHRVFGHYDTEKNKLALHDWPEWRQALNYVAARFEGVSGDALHVLVV